MAHHQPQLLRSSHQGGADKDEKEDYDEVEEEAVTPNQGADHRVQFYEDAEFLCRAVGRFAARGLREGEAVIVVARRQHLEGIERTLAARGIDLAACRARGQLSTPDADALLAQFMVDTMMPDPELFLASVGSLVTAHLSRFPRLRVFGEMVDILCSTGCPAAAVRLEELWNDLAALQQRLGRQFSLLCGYALGQFGREEHTRVFRDVCAAHARVLPAESYGALREDRDNQERLIAGLQQQALALQAEVAHRHAVEARLLQAKEAAEAANRAKSRFLAIISHELRTPLTAIVGYTELMLAPAGEGLEKGETSAGERQETLEVILRNGRELVRLLNDVLDLSKMEAGLLQVERVPFKPADLMADVMDVLCLQAAEKRLRVRVEMGRDVPERVLGDPTRLRQILLNVVGNALKFTPADGTVDVALRMLGHATLSSSPSTSPPPSSPSPSPAASFLECTVRDTGCGMTPEHALHLFRPFSQGPDSSMSRHHGGTGLGLFLSRQLARLLGGDLVLAHTAPGHGATFVATVQAEPDPVLPDHHQHHPHQAQAPVVTAMPPSQPLRELSAEGIDRASISVLVVDDNAVNRRLVQRVLERLGYVDVDTAADGLQALNRMAERHSDLVLMDLQMPMMDGHSACQAIRKIYEDQQRAQQPVIIALTAQALSDERDRCVASGMDDFVSKPFDFKVLTHKLAHWTSIIAARRRSN